jgi:hypothetical protein
LIQIQTQAQKTPGNTFGEARTIPPLNAITCLTRTYNPHHHFSGFGTPNAVTNFRSSLGFSLWTD